MNKYVPSKSRVSYTKPYSYSGTVIDRVRDGASNPGAHVPWPSFYVDNFSIPAYREYYEEITDQGDGNNRDKWNDFEHYTVNGNFPRTKFVMYSGLNGSLWYNNFQKYTYDDPTANWLDTYGDVDSPIKGLPVLFERNPATNEFIKKPDGIDDVIARGNREILRNIKPRLSVLNSVYELKDFRTFNRTVERALGSLRMVRKHLHSVAHLGASFFSKRGKRTLLSLVGSVSDMFLQMQFNILPLDGDLEAIRDAIRTVQKEVNKLLSDEGTIKNHHFNWHLDGIYSDSLEQGPETFLASGFRYPPCPPNKFWMHRQDREVHYQKRSVHVQVKYSKYFSQWERENAQLLGMLDALGVMFDPSIIWNATRWTFVIDWVIGVSNFLKQFSVPNLNPVTIIHNSLWSLNVRRTLVVNSHYHLGMPPGHAQYRTASGPVNVCGLTEHAYKRVNGISTTLETLQASGLNPKEFILASALYASRTTPSYY